MHQKVKQNFCGHHGYYIQCSNCQTNDAFTSLVSDYRLSSPEHIVFPRCIYNLWCQLICCVVCLRPTLTDNWSEEIVCALTIFFYGMVTQDYCSAWYISCNALVVFNFFSLFLMIQDGHKQKQNILTGVVLYKSLLNQSSLSCQISQLTLYFF